MSWVGRLDSNIKAVLLAAGLLLAGLLFRQLVTLLVAFLITVLISIPLSACASSLKRRFGIPRAVGALAGLLGGVLVIAGTLVLIIPPFVDDFQVFVDDVPGIVESLQSELEGITGSSGETGSSIQSYLQGFVDDPGQLVGPLTSIGISAAGVIGALILIVLTAFYIAVDPAPLLRGFYALFPPRRREWARDVVERLRVAWIGWMEGVLIDMLITGVLLYIGLMLIGVDFAIVFAVISALLVVIPYFGAIAGAIPPTLYALTDSPEKALLALGIYVLIQQIESNVTIPLVMAQRVKLHPAIVAIGVVVVGQLFGFVGLFVAVPILSLFVIAVDELWVRPMERAPETGVDPGDPDAEQLELDDAPPDEGGAEPAVERAGG